MQVHSSYKIELAKCCEYQLFLFSKIDEGHIRNKKYELQKVFDKFSGVKK